MTAPARGSRAGSASDEHALANALGLQLVVRLHGLFRAVRLYDAGNATLLQQLDEVLALLARLLEEDDEVIVVAMGQSFYVQGARVKAPPAVSGMFGALTSEFESRGLGGLRLLRGLERDELASFARLFNEHADGERGRQLPLVAADAGIHHVVPLRGDEVAGAASAEEDDTARDARARARQTFERAVAGTRAVLDQAARSGRPAMRQARRVVQPLVDQLTRDEYSIIGLTAIKDHDQYTFVHCVNVSILSIALGQRLGLSRADLGMLGVAALLHDTGKVAVPSEVLHKPGRLSPEEWGLIQRHPLRGLAIAMLAPGLSPMTLATMRVALEHHRTLDGRGYPASPAAGATSVLSRIVTVADCFDAMTAHRAYRARPFTGYETLHAFLGPDRAKFDPAVLWALVRSVGLYPAGTVFDTASGYRVLSMNPDAADPARPCCRVLARPDGSVPPPEAPELWEPMAATERVAAVVPPEGSGVDVDALLAA